jgi:hypothetical protein
MFKLSEQHFRGKSQVYFRLSPEKSSLSNTPKICSMEVCNYEQIQIHITRPHSSFHFTNDVRQNVNANAGMSELN